MGAKDQQDYDTIAAQYNHIESLPHSKISQELVLLALGDCTGQKILDLGGGTGLHARNAINAGAKLVDNVDISPAMLEGCSKLEEANGRRGGEKVRCFVGDVGKELKFGGEGEGGYDVVMMIWTFDHATTIDELRTMWKNTAKYCKPGGKVISIRSTDPRKRPNGPGSGKYGVKLHDLQDVGQGDEAAVRYSFTVGLGDQAFTAVATNLDANMHLDKARAMAREFGFEDLAAVDPKECAVVKGDPEFWEEFVGGGGFVCVVGRKKST